MIIYFCDIVRPFVAEAVAAFAVSILAFAFLPSSPSKCNFLKANEQSLLIQKTNKSQDSKTKVSKDLADAKSEVNVLLKLVTDYRIISLCLTSILKNLGVIGIIYFAPLILEDSGMSTSNAALSVVIMLLLSMTFAQYWAMHSDRRGERIWHTILGLVMIIVGLGGAALILVTNLPLWILVGCLATARTGNQASSIPMQAIQADILPKNAANSGMAVITLFGMASGIIAPIMIGSLRSAFGGFATSLLFLSICAFLATACFLPLAFIRKRLHVEDDIEITA